ncbi:MAG: S41 family peptidase [Myxococcales bacterium]|nr:S41 family peptidase [Myxococcales bacterium]
MRRPRPRAGQLPALLGAGLAAAWLAAAAPAAAALHCSQIPGLVDAFFQHHVVHHELSDEIQARAIDTFLKRLDPSRTLFLEFEVEALRASMAGIFEQIRAGDCSRVLRLHQNLVARQRKVEQSVRTVASAEDFELDPSVTWVLDPDERGYPETEEERAELLRSRIHFQISNYLNAGETLDEAKRRLIHRYELRSKHLADESPEQVYAQFVDAVAASLDPHSSYLSSEVLEDFRIGMSLSLEGIGVALSERDGYAVAERIIPGGAADRHKGLEPKDKIIAVAQDGGEFVDIIDMPLRDSVSLIRGKKGTKVGLSILRDAEKTERFSITIVRDKIDLSEQAAKLRFEERVVNGKPLKLAILDLPSFYGDPDPGKRQSSSDVATLLHQVQEEKADGLVLDLSRNGGGLLQHAVTISGFFLRKGEIVGIQDSNGQSQVLVDRNERVLYRGPLVVHTSRASASASEILAGALKDYRRAVIAGDDHTFGKGTVQTVAEYPPGRGEGALKVTTQLFFRPGGRSTQHGGVKADVVIPSLLSSDDFGEEHQPYSLLNQEVAPFLGDKANGRNGSPARWRPVTNEMIATLSKRSRARIDSSEDFAKIRDKLRKADENGGVIRLSDIMNEKDEAKTEDASETTLDPHEATLTTQLEEAVNVLADLIEIQG